MDENNEEQRLSFSLTISFDRDGFFRHTCPACGLDFKSEVDQADIAYSLQPVFQQLGIEIGVNPREKPADCAPSQSLCPYCGQESALSDMHTEEMLEYAERFLMREYVLPKVNEMFGDFADSFKSDRGRTRGFGIQIKFEHHRIVLPPAPLSGPEPPDMTKIELLCCNKSIKMLSNWLDISVCPFCSNQIQLI